MPTEEAMIHGVHDCVAAFDKNAPESPAALFAENGTVEDPVGAPIVKGLAAIRDFYAQAMTRGAKPRLGFKPK